MAGDLIRTFPVFCACFLVGAAVPAAAQDGAAGVGQFGPAVRPQEGAAVGQTISRVDVEVATSSGDPARDEEAVSAARAAAGALLGRAYRPVLVDTALGFLISEGKVRAATHRPAFEGARGALGIVVSLDVSDAPAPEARAVLPEGGFPVIHQDDRSELTFIVSAGAGVYSDFNPWFGQAELFNEFSPVAGKLPGDGTTWTEAYVELGLGGVTRVAESNFYVYGAASGLFSMSRGQDIFTDDDRNELHPDKGYVGLLYADRATGNTAQFSLGRQTYTLNTGFLISMISGNSNAGERGASYLGPRNTTDFSALVNGEVGRFRYAMFYIDPDELEDLESNTEFAGVNIGYGLTDALSIDASLITIPNSDSTYRTPAGEALAREDTTTWGLHGLYRPTTPDHLWLEAEGYRQDNDNYDMEAYAYYGSVGYIRKSSSWSPSLSYRYASFSGDDPDTEEFERFDSLMSTGLGNWLQGLSLGKVYRNGNLNTHRIQANVSPQQAMNVTFTWHQLRADELNNLGANPALSQLQSRDIGDEYTMTLRWSINRNLYWQAVASRAFPGRALKLIGADDPWTTLQTSFYFNF